MQYNMKNKLVENRCNFPRHIPILNFQYYIRTQYKRESPYILRSINGSENKSGYSIFSPNCLIFHTFATETIVLLWNSHLRMNSIYYEQGISGVRNSQRKMYVCQWDKRPRSVPKTLGCGSCSNELRKEYCAPTV